MYWFKVMAHSKYFTEKKSIKWSISFVFLFKTYKVQPPAKDRENIFGFIWSSDILNSKIIKLSIFMTPYWLLESNLKCTYNVSPLDFRARSLAHSCLSHQYDKIRHSQILQDWIIILHPASLLPSDFPLLTRARDRPQVHHFSFFPFFRAFSYFFLFSS